MKLPKELVKIAVSKTPIYQSLPKKELLSKKEIKQLKKLKRAIGKRLIEFSTSPIKSVNIDDKIEFCCACNEIIEGSAIEIDGRSYHTMRKCAESEQMKLAGLPFVCPVCDGEPDCAELGRVQHVIVKGPCQQCHGRGFVKKKPVQVTKWITE